MGPAAVAGQTAPSTSAVATATATPFRLPGVSTRRPSYRMECPPLDAQRPALTEKSSDCLRWDFGSRRGGSSRSPSGRVRAAPRARHILYGEASWGEIMAHRRVVAGPAEEGALLWEPTGEDRARARIPRYLAW